MFSLIHPVPGPLKGVPAILLLGILIVAGLYLQLSDISRVQAGSPNQAMLFRRIWGGSSFEAGTSLARDASNSIIVAGNSNSFGAGGGDVLLLKYSAASQLQWARTWGGSQNDSASDVAVDQTTGDIYVTGATQSFGAVGSGALLLKFNTAGSFSWAKTWGGSGTDYAAGVVVDSAGNVFVAGVTNSTGAGGRDAFILKYNSTGSLLWQRTWGGSGDDVAQGIAIASDGSLYVTGFTNSFGAGGTCSYPTTHTCYDVFMLKLNSSGRVVWQETWGAANIDEKGSSIAIDQSNNLYVMGTPGVFSAFLLLRMDSTGAVLWARTERVGCNGVGESLAVDPLGNAYVAGESSNCLLKPPREADLVKFNSTGSMTWHGIYYTSNPILTYALLADSAGIVLATGFGPVPPSFSLYSVNQVGSLTYTPQSTSAILRTPTFTSPSPSGLVTSPVGSEASSSNHLFLYKYGPSAPLTFRASPVTAGNATCQDQTYFQTQNLSDGNVRQFPPNAILSCTADPAHGYVLSRWAGNGTGFTSPVSFNITRGSTLIAYFGLAVPVAEQPLSFFLVSAAVIQAQVVAVTLLKRRAKARG